MTPFRSGCRHAASDGRGPSRAQKSGAVGRTTLGVRGTESGDLARDIEQTTKAGFRLEEVTPIDVAPQTYNVTAVALFLR